MLHWFSSRLGICQWCTTSGPRRVTLWSALH